MSFTFICATLAQLRKEDKDTLEITLIMDSFFLENIPMDENTSECESEVSLVSLQEDLTDLRLDSLDDERARNAKFLRSLFRVVRISPDSKKMLQRGPGKWKDVFASYLSPRCLNPLLYRQTMWRPGNLQEFIAICRSISHIDNETADNLWVIVSSLRRVRRHLRAYSPSIEADILHWQARLNVSIEDTMPHMQFSPTELETLLGVRGALLVQEQAGDLLRTDAGFKGRADYAYKNGSDYVALMEFKILRNYSANPSWYSVNSLLAQSICWLAGTPRGPICVIQTNIGWKLLYRINIRENVYSYHCYPQGEEFCLYNQQIPAGSRDPAKKEYLRVIFEILLCTISRKGTPPSLDSEDSSVLELTDGQMIELKRIVLEDDRSDQAEFSP